MSTVRSFLPWYRRGLPSTVTAQTARSAGRVHVPLTVGVHGRGQVADVPVAIFGPGDVIGLDTREVLRRQPFDGCTSAEASLFAHVELAADLPWRFTPTAPDARGRLQPWLVLVVVDAAVATPEAADPLPVLSCPSGELPDVADAWAWAHVQVTRQPSEDVSAVVRDTPARAAARLVCPRQLRPQSDYVACLVPSFEAGRLAGLRRDPATAADPFGPAWRPGEAAELPVYHHWRFSTARAGSFESLVRALRPQPLLSGASGRSIPIDEAGWGMPVLDRTDPASTLPMHGLLQEIGSGDPAPIDIPGLTEALRKAIEQYDEHPRIRPPLYGQDYADRRDVPSIGEAPRWLRDLNLDPRHRIAAALGTMAVRVLQEDLVAEAWRQLAQAHRPADEENARQLSDAIAERLGARPAASPTLARLTRRSGPIARGQLAARGSLLAAPFPARSPARLASKPGDAPVPRTGFVPVFADAVYDVLATVHPDWVLPGLTSLPADAVMAVELNLAFAEAFLVGLNHELARELLWRRFPVDRTGTFFSRFWPATTGAKPAPVPELRGWTSGPLGGHVAQAGSLILLVRGDLLRRYPQTHVYALRGDPDTASAILPSFSARLGEDVTLVGFPLSSPGAFDEGDLWFVLEEDAQRARFGCDEASAPAPAEPAVWQDLQWGNADFAARTYLPAEGPLAGRTLAVSHTGTSASEHATWGRDAAHMAAITQQPPLRAVLPARRWRPPDRNA